MFVELVDDVRQWFADRDFEIVVAEGVEAPSNEFDLPDASQQGRVAFVPMSTIGVGSPRFIGDEPERVLIDTEFPFEVHFTGTDPEQPERDLAHRLRCMQLWQITNAVIQSLYAGQFEWTSARWDETPKHGRHGAELVATLVLHIPLHDFSPATAATPAPRPGDPKPAP